jgi:hypothetical protein
MSEHPSDTSPRILAPAQPALGVEQVIPSGSGGVSGRRDGDFFIGSLSGIREVAP